MNKITKRYPQNPYVLSRMGRLCLEAGRKQEALDYFNQIHKIMKSTSTKQVESPLSTGDTSTDAFDPDLEALCLMNRY
jgi:hypothetical protein